VLVICGPDAAKELADSSRDTACLSVKTEAPVRTAVVDLDTGQVVRHCICSENCGLNSNQAWIPPAILLTKTGMRALSCQWELE
jgi:hypothetical protein